MKREIDLMWRNSQTVLLIGNSKFHSKNLLPKLCNVVESSTCRDSYRWRYTMLPSNWQLSFDAAWLRHISSIGLNCFIHTKRCILMWLNQNEFSVSISRTAPVSSPERKGCVLGRSDPWSGLNSLPRRVGAWFRAWYQLTVARRWCVYVRRN